MFERVLVANRGEIAVRVMRACEELGIDTVAVYSEADRHAGHVRYADEAYNVGPARAAESYLDDEAIVDAARRADADAIHPGYGFLAENADFAARVEAADGITWVGPTSDAMETLGEKTSARLVMDAADVPIVPGTTDPVTDPEGVIEFGEEHGFPVAIKAEGGGGGRGMKIVESAEEAADQLQSARREGEAYFDNDSVYLERYLDGPRHIEVQILADHHDNVRHLGERDCSLQRRHQKVIEEAPSPAIDDGMRERIGEAARRGVREADYTNAGTVEFLVADDSFYFLEVNTRIQVEHTVTEEITGIDIVKWQLRVAADEPIGFAQEDVGIEGHAMEFRINAENAAEQFAPQTGVLDTYDPPGGIGVRMDEAVRQGDRIGGDYDSMIAKLIVRAGDREACLARSRRALAEYEIEGLVTVLPFHRLMLTDERFTAGEHTTAYLDEQLDPERIADAQQRWGTEPPERDDGEQEPVEREFTVEVNGKRFEVTLEDRGGLAVPTDTAATGGTTTGDDESESDAESRPGPHRESGDDDAGGGAAATGEGEAVTADMQGTILGVEVAEGDAVERGDVLGVLEAMKMENDVVAPRSGTVTRVAVAEGDSVDTGETLFVIG